MIFTARTRVHYVMQCSIEVSKRTRVISRSKTIAGQAACTVVVYMAHHIVLMDCNGALFSAVPPITVNTCTAGEYITFNS